MERYYISHVKKDVHKVVTDVMLHFFNGQSLNSIGVRNIAHVIQLINSGESVYTTVWGYPEWKIGAEVIVIRNSFLKTNRNETDKDNLDNLIPL